MRALKKQIGDIVDCGISDASLSADVPPGQVVIWISEELLAVAPDYPLCCERFDGANTRLECGLSIGHTEAEEDNISLVPTNFSLEGCVGDNEAMLADSPSRRDKLDEVF